MGGDGGILFEGVAEEALARGGGELREERGVTFCVGVGG